MTPLKDVLEKFSNRLTYSDLDTRALNISRSAAAGNLGDDGDYAEWAMMSNDPLVVVNQVSTYITTLTSKLTSQPFRPENQDLFELGIKLHLNTLLADTYHDVLSDGYAFVGIGIDNGVPQVRTIDSRYILFSGDDPTLKSAHDVVVFQIVPRDLDDEIDINQFPEGYISFDVDTERVITSYYHNDGGQFVLDVYANYVDKPKRYVLKGLDRIPIVRFVGRKIELEDKRFHYRGLYHQTASVIKAMCLSATKIQIRTASQDDANYIAPIDAIDNHMKLWQNSGVKTYDSKDANCNDVAPPTPIVHDNEFLISAFNNWKSVLADMLGPVVASGSEAVTREEVIARNEVRDAITNEYLSKFVDSVSEVYRCLQMFTSGDTAPVIVLGGYLDSVKRAKYNETLSNIYNIAKDTGLNVQGIPLMMVQNADLPNDMKSVIANVFAKDQYASPLVQQMKQQVQQLQNTNQQQQTQLTQLKIQATQRLERQAEYTEMMERIKKNEMLLEQWKEEQKQTQEARMEILRKLLEQGDAGGAMQMLASIQRTEAPIVVQPSIVAAVNQTTPDYVTSVKQQIAAVSASQGNTNVASNSSVGQQTTQQ